MSRTPAKRSPNVPLRWILMLVGVVVVFGGVFFVKSFFAKQTNTFFDNMPQPAVAVSTYDARTERWSSSGEAVGTFVAVNGTDVTTEAGGVVRSIEFDAGQPVAAGAVLVRLNTANEDATLKALQASAQLASCQTQRQRHHASRPSANRTTRSQRAASSGAWVTMTSVAPMRSRRSNSRSITAAPLAASRLPASCIVFARAKPAISACGVPAYLVLISANACSTRD